jgi:hypothetical protein
MWCLWQRVVQADVAQLVEQRIRNAKVVSSIPIIGTNLKDEDRVNSIGGFLEAPQY